MRGRGRKRGEMRGRQEEIERGVKVLYVVLTLYCGSPREESQ